MEVEIENPCPNSPDSEPDDSGIKKFLESFQSFLTENKSVSAIPIDSFLAQTESPPCTCPKRPCRPQERILKFKDLFGENSRSPELQ